MELIFDLVDLNVLTNLAREVEPPNTYGPLQALLPVREIQDVEYKIRNATITRGVANYRAWDAETPIGRRRAQATTTKQPLLPLGQKLMVGEYESIMLRRAQGVTDGGLVDQVYDDTRSNVQAIRARMQKAIGQVLSTGSFTLANENGLTDVADFDVPSTHLDVTPTGTELLWSDPDADIFGFLERISELYQTDSEDGQLPGSFMTSRRVVNNVRRNKQIIRGVWGPLASEGLVTPAQANEVLTAQGLPALQVDETKVGGVRVIPDDTVIVGPSNPEDLGRTVYGITGQAIELAGSNAVDLLIEDAPGIVAFVLKTADPLAIWSAAEASGLPVLERPELLMTLAVL